MQAQPGERAPGQRVRWMAAPNAFKGSLTAAEAAAAMAEGVSHGFRNAGLEPPTVDCVPVADGGDGTLDTLVAATHGEIFQARVRGPLGTPVLARWGRLGGDRRDTAVIEMAEASGLRLLQPHELDPLHSSTFGTGQLMRAAIDAGCTTLIVGIGGSATNDGGAGMAQALGARLLDSEGRGLLPGGADLARLERVDTTGLAVLEKIKVLVACDVDNPLTGALGASAVYGPQKGATPEMVSILDSALTRYATKLRMIFSTDVSARPGAGAAGGLGAGLMAFCGAELQPGSALVLDAVGFEDRLRGCQMVITGEGRLDSQTERGKIVAAVAWRCLAAGVPAVGLAGSIEPGADSRLQAAGLLAVLSIVDGPMTVEQAMADSTRLITAAAARVARMFCLGLKSAGAPLA